MPGSGCRAYPPAVVTRDRSSSRTGAPPPDPVHGDGVDGLLTHAVDEAARLLEADGAMVYLLDEDDGRLHFAHAAGIGQERTQVAVSGLALPVGTGLFGRAVADRTVVVTDDYPADPSFQHAPAADRVVEDVGIRSMVVAPLVAGDAVFGALGAFATRPAAFDAAEIALVRALADHAAAAMANARLIDQLDRSRTELRERAEVERSLREIAARISEASDLEAVLQRSVDEAARLLDADSARIDLIDPRLNLLRWAYASGAERPSDEDWPEDPDERLDHGISGQAVVTGRPFWTGDYLADERFPRGKGSDAYARATGLMSVLAAPLVRESRAFGTLTVMSTRPDAWGEAEAAVLAAIADQAAITMTTARLIEELDRSRESLERRAEAEQALREIAGRLTSIRDPADLLQHVVDEATRLIRADGAILDLYDPATGIIRWAYESGLTGTFTPEETAELWIEIGVGATGRALGEDRVIVAGDDLVEEFPRNAASDLFFGRTGFRSMIAAPIAGEAGRLGVLEVFSRRRHAFDQADVDLIQGLASQAAVAITNARLIEELARSREEQARAAEAERALREIGARMTVMREQGEILQAINDEAARLLRASGSMINLVGNAGLADAWTHLGEGGADRTTVELLDEVELEPDAGVSGLALGTGTTQMSDDYLTDARFTHTPERDAFVREAGIRSVISCPFKRGDEILGVLTVYADRPNAFGPGDTRILEALADQGAVTIMNARLIRALEQSREEVARRADSERTLREIAARVSAILDPAEVLQPIVDEAARLLESDGARIDLYDEALGALRWAYAAGDAMHDVPDWGAAGGLKPRQAVAGLAFAERRPIISADYLEDDRFETTPQIEAFVKRAGIRSVVSAPLFGEHGPLGTISVVSRSPGAYAESDAEILTALATQASIAITNARLMDELARSRAVIERRAAAEQALREIAARITAIREPGDLLQHVIDEAARLLRADGALIDLYDPETQMLHWAYDSGLPDPEREHVKRTSLKLGEGVSGLAVAESRVIVVDDYLATDWFAHKEDTDKLADQAGLRSLIAAPIIGEDGPLGVVEVFRREPHAFDEIDAAVLGGLADQAAVAMTNAHLIEQLARSREEIARRAETERSLRDITARIASIQDPAEVLQRVVEEAKRLLRSDGAHLTRLGEDGTYLVPVVVADPTDPATGAWLRTQEFPLGGGINGLAAAEGHPIWTEDYLEDPRIPHEPDDLVAAERLGLRGMAAAPLRAPHGEVIGTLAISYEQPRRILPDELDLLQGLADQAAIALTNSNLLARLTESEGRYRYLVQNSPDLVWSIDHDARLTFVSDTCERLTGYRPEELLGRHFGALVHPSSKDVAEIDWSRSINLPSQELRGRVNLLRRDGSALPAEFIAMASRGPDGRFIGANGSVRDMTEQIRLERELQESESRYRTLASSSPDLVFATDAEGRYTFLSDRVQHLLGYEPAALIGRSFTDFVSPSDMDAARASYGAIVGAPEQVHQTRLCFRHVDGGVVPFEVNVIGALDDGRLRAIHGVARDVSERERLERELRESEERYRYLVSASPDLVWVTDEDGRLTFVSEASEAILGRPWQELVGRRYWEVFSPASEREARTRFRWLSRHPTAVHRSRVLLRHADGHDVVADINGIGMTGPDGRFIGAHGAVRDVSERERLERDLRRQAGELASSEERAHLARELHDSVTQALFSMTLVARSVELLLDRDLDGARAQLGQLRELQREALAEMRALIFELRPGNLEQDGLIHALRTHSAALQGRIGLPIVVESELVDRLPLELEEVLYRIAQEALHNVVKHAAARQVRLEIRPVREGVRMRVVDDGKGFDPAAVPDAHLGIAGMRARAAKIDALFDCRSEPGRGTTIEIIVPEDVVARARRSVRATPTTVI
jgi:PAS domain S-box-containing protein